MAILGSIFITILILMTLVRWVLRGKIGFYCIGVAFSTTAIMACVLRLEGERRYWALLPVSTFIFFTVMILRDWYSPAKE